MKKGNAWYFGYKAHVGVDKDSGLVHTLEVTAANEHDVTMISKLLHGEEETANGDSGYIGADKREKSSVRAKVEHVFAVVKEQLRYRKTRYRGLQKQTAKLNLMFALANLILAGRPSRAAV